MKKRALAIIILAVMLLPLICAGAFASGGVKLPSGYVTPDKVINFKNGIDQQDFSLFDGLALTVSSISSGGCYRLFTANGTGENKDEVSIFYDDSNGLIVLENGADNGEFSLSGSYSFAHNGTSYHSDVYYEFDYSFELTGKNIRFSSYRLTVDFDTYQRGYLKRNGEYAPSSPLDERKEGVRSYATLHLADTDHGQELHLSIPTVPLAEEGWAQAISIDFKIEGVKPRGNGASGGATGNASWSSGEDEGVTVPAAIVIGVLGAGAAIAGAAAASGGDGGDEDGKRSTYKMYVQKDFGDAIRRGADMPSVIRARMAEVTPDGAERDRDDLTAMISVSGEGMDIESAVLRGRYVEASVRIPEGYEGDTANIVFTFTGEGGVFENRVVFRVVDGPSLKFMEETPEGYVPYHENCGIDAIPGDGFTYTRLFTIEDATKAPSIEDISAVDTGEFEVGFEPTGSPAVYKMHVKNNTPPLPEHDIFAKPSEKDFEIRVNVEGESKPLLGSVGVRLYPEGITIASDQEGKKNDVKYVRVRAYEKDRVGDLDKKWQVSQIRFTLAVKGEDKAIIDPHEAKYSLEKLEGSGGLGMRADKEQCLAEKYEHKETLGEWNDKIVCEFEPNAILSEPEDGTFLMVMLPASAEYDGKTYKAEIPLRLRGKDVDPMGDWEKEYKELERRVEKFSLPENKEYWLENMKKCATDPRVSVEELRLVSKWILREYMDYWTTQQSRAQAEATMYNVIVNVLEWTKFAGDCAFSFLISAYAGPVAEALLSPVKDFAAGAIGEVIAAVNNGENLDLSIMDRFEFSKNLAAAGDNLVSNAIDLKNWRKAAATLGGYFVYCAMKNYLLKLNEKGESDIWGSLCDAFKDMTGAALKSKAGDLIGKWLESSKTFQEKIGPKIASYFQETSFDTLQKKLNDSLDLHGDLRKVVGYSNDKVFEAKVKDVVEKYISGLVGQGFDKVREAYDSSKFVLEDGFVYYCFTLHLFDALHYGIKLNLTRILQAMSGDLSGWFYDYFFAGVPAAETVVEVPKDPKLPVAVK